jgi:hypothetical protein
LLCYYTANTYTTVNDLPNEFALVRLGKKVMWEGSHKVSSYQTLVKRPIESLTKLCKYFWFNIFLKEEMGTDTKL